VADCAVAYLIGVAQLETQYQLRDSRAPASQASKERVMALNSALTVHLKSRPRPCSAEEAIRFEREFASKNLALPRA
jgi:hypothetical protein